MAYDASILTELDSLNSYFDILFKVFPSPIYVLSITYVLQAADLFEILIF